jgi:large repetitive protein
MRVTRSLLAVAVVALIAPSCAEQEAAREPSRATLAGASFRSAGQLPEPRELPRVVLLPDSTVLAVGGGSELQRYALATTMIYNPRTNTWTAGPPLGGPRRDAEVVTLRDGRILAIGGSPGPERTGSTVVEALDPATRTWRTVAKMNVPRIGHAAALLADGRVLVTGGQAKPGDYLRSAEVYDPAADRWTLTPDMNDVRNVHHARRLRDGSVLVIGGGTDQSATNTTELYNPSTNTWTMVGALKEPRWGFASAVLPDGKVMIAGGRVPGKKGFTLPEDVMILLDGVEIYDPATRAWTSGAPLAAARSMGLPNVDLIPLGNGELMFAGGRTYPEPYHGTNASEIYSTATNSWRAGPSLLVGRSYQAAVHIPGHGVLVVGGRGRDFLPMKETDFLPLTPTAAPISPVAVAQ